MRVLFVISTDFPYAGSCTSLLNNLLNTELFLASDHQFSVLSLGCATIDQTVERLNNIDIYRTYLRSQISIRECKKKFFQKPWKVFHIILTKVYTKIYRGILNKAINAAEVKEIVQKLHEIEVEQYDVIVPIFGNLPIAAAALEIKTKYPKKKVVIYQVDPCSSNEEYPASMRKELAALEEELFVASDRIITTAILFQEAQKKYSNEIRNKMIAMEFPNVVPKSADRRPDTNAIKKCLFTGCIYGNIRDPEYTFRLFHLLDSEICLELIGAISSEAKTKCEEYEIVAHGPKTLMETRSEIEKAHILVNIGNSMLNQVPSKLFEYISYGKPIVNICKNRNCPTIAYLEHYPYALSLFEEDYLLEEQRTKLISFINDNYNKEIPFEIIRNEYESSTPEYCAKQMMGIFDELKDCL